MIESNYYDHEIILHNISVGSRIERLPNKLVWAINSFLASQYDLYEYYISNAKDGEYQIEVPCLFPKMKKYICLNRLHETYIKAKENGEGEIEEEFKKHRSTLSYDEFCDIYAMESISELKYFAVSDIQETISLIKSRLNETFKGKIFKKTKIITQAINATTKINILIGDHDYMRIYSKEHRLIAEIKEVIIKSEDSVAKKNQPNINP